LPAVGIFCFKMYSAGYIQEITVMVLEVHLKGKNRCMTDKGQCAIP